MKKKIFVVTYGGGHANIISSLYSDLVKEFEVSILALTVSEEHFKSKKIPFKALDDYLPSIDMGDNIVEIGTEFIKKYNIDFSRMGLNKSAIYYGCCVRDYIDQHDKASLDDLYKEQGRLLFIPDKTMSKILEIEKPDAVLTTNSPRFERAAILSSRKKGIVNYSIEDLLGDSRVFSINDDYKDYYGDYILVINDYVKKVLVDKGVKATDIVPTGQPSFEGVDSIESTVNNFRSLYGIEEDKRVICWASHVSEDEEKIFYELIDVFSNDSHNTLIIKPHPNEDYRYMKDYINKINTNNVKLIDDCSIRAIIAESDVLMTQYSTCGLEAIMMNTPVLVLNPYKREFDSDYSKLDLALRVDDIKDIHTMIDKAINEGIRKFSVPQNACKNIVQTIKRTLI